MTALDRVRDRLDDLSASMRREAPRRPVRRSHTEPSARTCDECHHRKPITAFDAGSRTCRLCAAELATPRLPRRRT